MQDKPNTPVIDFQHLVDDISQGRINEAIAVLRPVVDDARQRALLSKAADTYALLTKYFLSGVADPGRKAMYSSIQEDLYSVCEALRRERMMPDSPSPYFAAARLHRLRNSAIEAAIEAYRQAEAQLSLYMATDNDDLSQHKQYKLEEEQALDQVFDLVWTSDTLTPQQTELIADCLVSSPTSYMLKATLVNALVMALLQYYDRAKLMLLIDVAENPDQSLLAARALPGIIFTLRKYGRRVKSDTALQQRLAQWPDSIIVFSRLQSVVKQMLLTRDTERVADKMRKEVIPELMKFQPEIMKRMQDFSENSDVAQFEENPEWEEALQQSGLADRLQEIGQMQAEGADVMMVPFSNLKDFPFFRTPAHWLVPFEADSSLADEVSTESDRVLAGLLADIKTICNSDKYSLLLSLARMPKLQKELMEKELKEKFEVLKEAVSDNTEGTSEFDNELSLFMRDLYRFNKLFPRRQYLYDPFAKPVDFLNVPALGSILTDEETVRLAAEFYFKRSLYADALPYLLHLYDNDATRTDLLEKIAFCYQCKGDLPQAAGWYDRALSARGQSQWLLKKIAFCAKMTGDFTKAADFYGQALENESENVSLLVNYAHALCEAGQPGKALQAYYKAAYLSPNAPVPARGILHCEMIAANYDKADMQMDRLTQLHPNERDYILFGHLNLLQGRNMIAADNYRTAMEKGHLTLDSLRTSIANDIKSIPALAGQSTELNLILDTLYPLA